MNLGGGYQQPLNITPGGPAVGVGGQPFAALLSALAAHTTPVTEPATGVLQSLRSLLGGYQAPAVPHVVNPQVAAQDNYVQTGPLGGWGAVSRGIVPAAHPLTHRPVTVHLQVANPNLYGDHGYTHPVMQYLGRH